MAAGEINEREGGRSGRDEEGKGRRRKKEEGGLERIQKPN